MRIPSGFEDLFDDATKAFLALATVRPDGSPVVVPVWFVADDTGLLFSTGVDSFKARDMRERPVVAGMVMEEGEHARYVSVRGTAHEVLTPDSSRFWPADLWDPGHPQPSFDKQYVRDWLTSPASGWDRRSGEPPPPLPGDVVEQTRAKYVEAYERLTGRRWR